jgi:hypothetical protein
MRQAAWWPKISLFLVLASLATIEGETAAHVSTQQFAKPAFCSGPAYRQFDFWIGDSDALETAKREVVARTRVDRILDGCVLREDYESTNGLRGQSFSLYDASRRIWKRKAIRLYTLVHGYLCAHCDRMARRIWSIFIAIAKNPGVNR